ncbi:chemotaxis protein CheB [Schlesneria paludicola]|uniref:chemotaxis protein CheB n=1 Tax=Schlesneria paludicola TaxID=360056 RepID=UPI00029B4DA2|nr:chemotaxis protein CheB [Schlesneria paludicola]
MSTEEKPSDAMSTESNLPTYVVGIGASAGGLEALERLFSRMPANTGMAFVVVQHLSPDFKSLMDELLSRRTSLPVLRVENGMAVEPNSIYLIPPRREMILSDGKLLLTEIEPHQGLSLPIDYFFRSLAQSYGRNAIAVVMSGTGSDGSRGIQDIHAAGGLVIAQTPRTAKFDGMPDAARETGVVDLSLDPEDIPTALVQYSVRHNLDDLSTHFENVPADEEGLAAILRLLRDQHGIDFSTYKLNTVVRRTERRLQINRIDAVKDYLQRLERDPVELDALYHDLLVGVTRFFRDEDAFERLSEEIDESLKRHDPKSEFRAWVAGCATGEEAYSIAILLDERIQACGKQITARIFATDVHRPSLEFAGHGQYRRESIGNIPSDRLVTYFLQTDRGFTVHPRIRQMVVFAPHNIIKDAPFTRMELVTCRNLLIYLQPGAQKKAISLFHFGLKANGILFLGPSESTGELEEEFTPIDRHWNIYRKRRDVRLNVELRPALALSGRSLRASGLPEFTAVSHRGIDDHLASAYDALLAEFMPPGLLIDSANRLLHVFGDAGKYLRHPAGRAGNDVLDSMEPQLKLAVVGAIRRTQVAQQPTHLRGVMIGSEPIELGIRPVINSKYDVVNYLITFTAPDTATPPASPADGAWIDMQHVSENEMKVMEVELRRAKENTQALIEELETSNEELQATNEELVASNEELQSTNEELHSVNEELYTVNAEHQRKIQELTVLTDDMENLLHSTQIHTLFLDRQLRIRRFTPAIGDIFSLVPHDIGRSIEAFHNRLQDDTLLDELRDVLKTGNACEKEVQSHAGRWFLMRILPYTTDKGNEGVVLTLTDINVTRRAQMNLKRVIDFFPHAVIATDDQGLIQMVNQRTQLIFGYDANEMIGQPVEMLLPERFREKIRLDRQQYALQHQHAELDQLTELSGRRKNGEEFPVEVSFNSINTEKGLLILASVNDITIRQLTQQELARREEELRLVINSVPMLIAYIDVNYVYRYVNNFYCEKLNLSPDDVRDHRIEDVVDAETYEQKRGHLERVFAGEPFTAEIRRSFPCDPSHRETWILAHYVPDRDESGKVRGCFVAMNDITELKELVASKQLQVEQRDLFLATLSHELRNPLGAVTSALWLLQANRDNTELQRTTLAAIDRQTRQMTALLDDLLDVARVTRGKIALDRSPVALDQVIGESVESVMPAFDKRGQKVETMLCQQQAWVDGDLVRLRQIVTNLLSNASRYSSPGKTVKLSLSLEAASRSKPAMAVISVRDEGIGIAPDVHEKIFEPFAQLRRTHNEASEGLGLGLSLSRRLAELHGGTVTVISEGEGCGSEFCVRLPLIEAPAIRESSKGAPESVDGKQSQSIVLVEDNEDARDLLRQLLEFEQFEVHTAPDGLAGLELIRNVRPHFAVVDIGLPGMNGHELAREVRRHDRSTILIAATGYGQESDREAALDAGFDEHITKPLNFDELLLLLRRVSTPAYRMRPK